MLTSLRLRHFRSIVETELEFSQSGLTVLVGPNGAGKSNIIRCLELLGLAARQSLDLGLRRFGGPEALLPKALTGAEAREALMEIEYRVALPPPELYPPDVPDVAVRHRVALQRTSARRFGLASESIFFEQPLLTAAAEHARIYRDGGSEVIAPRSRIIIDRTGDSTTVNASPAIGTETIALYSRWLGFPYVQQEASDGQITALRDFLEHQSGFRPQATASPVSWRYVSFIDPTPPVALGFCNQLRAFRRYVSEFRRFELHLSELRRVQDVARHQGLQPDGGGLPAALRVLRRNPDRGHRLSSTLADIAPHVSGTRVASLKSGQEFVEFLEGTTNRAVESWNASDGTLRALAILLVLETSPPGGVLIIEEPEQSLHPWAVRPVVEHMREVISERDLQVLITTHSSQVLDCVAPEEVYVVDRNESQGTTATLLTQIADAARMKRGDIGRLWTQGLLHGIPRPF